MNPVKDFLEQRGVQADPLHIDATATVLAGLLKGTTESFAKLPLEAEPSGFGAELRRNAP